MTIQPEEPGPRYELLRILESDGKRDEAFEVAKEGLQIFAADPNLATPFREYLARYGSVPPRQRQAPRHPGG